MRDSSAVAIRIQLAAIRAMTPAQRLRLVIDWSESARRLAVTGLPARHPHLSDLELIELYAESRLPRPAARRSPA